MNTIGFALVCVGLVYSISLNSLFFSKKHVENYETKIFSVMVIINLVGLLLELLCILTINIFGVTSIFSIIINKIFLSSISAFISLWAIYVFYVTLIENDVERKNLSIYKNINNVIGVLFFLSIILFFVLPIEIYNSDGAIYCQGASTETIYVYSIIAASLSSLIITLKWKFVNKRKIIPLIAYIFGGIVMMMIQKFNPALTLSTTMQTIFIFLMYNTIENPDVKMIEQLDMAKLQAEKANAAKTEFLSSMSHEIRTPLNAIVGFSDCILEAETLSEAKDNAADIVNASETLLDIVNGILDISKIEAGKIEIVNTKYNAPNTYLELAKLIKPKMDEKGLDFSYTIAPDLPNTLLGDHANIKKIITNLLSNAYKYTDKGFVHYEVNCVNSNGVCKLIISVEDSGRGIKKESVDKMFTKFQRLDEDKNTTIEGTGLGLAITKQLTELMGGRIIVHTVYGQGSKFTVVINQKIEKDEAIDNKKIKTTLDLTDVRLLIVDDNPLNIKVATKIFEKFKANYIVTCESGFACIDKIKNGEEFDVILLDDMMPKKSGVETLAELKMIEGFNTPVVALTANAITGMKEKYLFEGFNDYLAKPIDKTEFIRVMNEILGRTPTENLNIDDINSKFVRDEIIVPEDKNTNIIPVEENIEEVLGSKIEITNEPIITEEVEMLDIEDNVRDDIIIPDLVPVVDINFDKYDRKYLEDNGVDVNHALELLGDIEMYNMTINDFMKEIDEKWSRIITSRDSKDMENYAIDVHSLKSDCKYLGFMSLADISYQHELKSKENDVEFVLNNFSQLEDEYYKMYEIAKKYSEHNKVED